MTLKTKPFNQMFSFSRAGGATRVNAAGLIVGVDFSATSNTIGTGSKTFVLDVNANVDRDWVVGSNVIAVSQAGATGSMTGTVTSYTVSTQTLVINVTSITGSGTSTDWRIGSLDFRLDHDPLTLAPRGGLVEGQTTNLRVPSSPLTAGNGDGTSSIATNTTTVTPDGSIYGFVMSPADSSRFGSYYTYVTSTGTAGITTESVFCKPDANLLANGFFGSQTSSSDPRFFRYTFATETLIGLGASKTKVEKYPNGWYRFSVSFSDTGLSGVREAWIAGTTNATTSSVVIWGIQRESSGSVTSFIPTRTVATTRAADIVNVDGSRFSSVYNQPQGTLVVEMVPTVSAVQAVTASINDGTLNSAIRIGQKQSGTTSSIRAISSDGVMDLYGTVIAAGSLNLVSSNGVEYQEINKALTGVAGKFGIATSGNGSFIAVGGAEAISTTTDSGTTFSPSWVSGSYGSYGGAHYGIGRFVIPSSASVLAGVPIGAVIVSTDGLTFRRINIPGLTQNLNEVTSNGTNQYVAVGAGGVIYTSPDAETWTAQTSGTASALTGVNFFGGRYVAVSSTSGASRYSDNGTSWAAVTGLIASMQDVAHNGTNLWVAVGNTGAIYSSDDGITWTQRTSGVATTLLGIHFADGLWVAVGNAGTVVTSPDGITWTDRTATSGTTNTIGEVGFFGGKFYYVGNITGGAVFENTASGIVAPTTWVSRLTIGANVYNGLATNGSRLLVCGSSGAIATSDDGITFTSRTGNNAQLNGASFGNGTYVVVGNAINGSGLIATVDPTTFAYKRRASNTTNSRQSVRFLGGQFVSTGNTGSVVTSPDGVTWTDRTAGTGTGQTLFDTAYSGSLYIVVGTLGTIRSSSDTVSWTTVTSGTTSQLNSADFANGLYVAVGAAGTIITSPNGTTWTLRTSGTTVALYAVRWNTRDQCFYAAGDSGVILRSVDGITWENIANDAIGAVVSGGVIQSNPALPNLVPGQVNKVAMRYAANNLAVSVNGSDPVTDTSGTVPSVNRISLGMSGVQTFPFNGHIRKLNYYPGVMSDSELKEITGL